MFNSDINRRHGFDWGPFLVGIASVILSFLILRNPRVSLNVLVIAFAILSIIQGVVWISMYFGFRELFRASWITLIAGILDLIIGVMIIMDLGAGAAVLTYLFIFWFITDSVAGIIFSWHLRALSSSWYFFFYLILNIISLGLSIYLLMNPGLALVTMLMVVAFYFMFFGVNEIVLAWMHR